MSNTSLTKKIKNIRLALRLTQEQFAQKMEFFFNSKWMGKRQMQTLSFSTKANRKFFIAKERHLILR
jgi:transcriptional regulator with XRE-family HTH domain